MLAIRMSDLVLILILVILLLAALGKIPFVTFVD